MKILFIPLIFLALLFSSCNDGPSSIGSDLVSSENLVIKTFDTSVDSVAQYTKYFKNVIPLGASAKILIGKSGDTEASGLIRFLFSFPDSLKADINDDNINVVEAKVTLTRAYQFGDSSASFNFSVHKVTSYWSPFNFTIDSLPNLEYDAADISSNLTATDTTYFFNLNSDAVSSWLKYSADNSNEPNYGMYLTPDASSGKILGFDAYTSLSTTPAELEVVIQKTGSYIDTIKGLIIADNSLVSGDLPVIPSDEIAVQSGISINAFVAFDFSSFPKGTVINSADLIFTEDTLVSKTGSSFSNSLKIYFVKDSSDMSIESASELTLNYSEGKFSGDISSYVQNWAFRENNKGIIIRPGNQFEGLELFALKGSNALDINIRPRIKIVYTVKNGL
jgi:hypothetical protein